MPTTQWEPGELDPAVQPVLDDLNSQHDVHRGSPIRAVLVPVLGVVAIMLIGGVIGYSLLRHDLNNTNRQLTSAEGQNQANAAALNQTQRQQLADRKVAEKLAAQLKQNGIKPSASISTVSPAPTPIPGPTGATGPIGPAPTQFQIQLALDSYCLVHANCAPAAPSRCSRW